MKYDDEKYELFKELYWKTLDQRNELYERVNLPLTIILGLATIVGYYFRFIPLVQYKFLDIVFLVIFLFMVGAIVLSICHLIKSYHNYEYGFLPLSDDIDQYLKSLHDYYSENQGDNIESESINQDLKEGLTVKYIKYETKNRRNNEKRKKNLYKANRYLIWAVVFFLISTLPFYSVWRSSYNFKRIDNQSHENNLFHQRETPMKNPDNGSENKDNGKDNDSDDSKPSFPEGRELKENSSSPEGEEFEEKSDE